MIDSLDINKSAGTDNIPPIFVKYCKMNLYKPLTVIFNASLEQNTFPAIWKKSSITPIYKSGNRYMAQNYRPISIVSKIYATLNDIEQKLILKLFPTLRDRIVRSFQVLQLNYRIPSSLCEHIDPQIKDELIEIDSTDSETNLDSIEIEKDSTNTIMTTEMTAIEFFNLTSKILPHGYYGSRDRLQDLIGDNNSIQDIAQKLRQGIKTESSQAVTSKILGHKQFQKDRTKYAEEIETLSVKLILH
nr:unnamed protein product [Callosobruchus chinensis]